VDTENLNLIHQGVCADIIIMPIYLDKYIFKWMGSCIFVNSVYDINEYWLIDYIMLHATYCN